MRRFVVSLGAAILLLALPGCTLQLIGAAEKVEFKHHQVTEVTRAWVAPGGGLTVCARGWPAEATPNLTPLAFHFSASLERSKGVTRPPPQRPLDAVLVGTVAPAPGALAEGCPEPPEDAVEVAVETIPPGHERRPQAGSREIRDAGWLAADAGPKLWFLAGGNALGADDARADSTGPPGRPKAGAPDAPKSSEPKPAAAAILYRHDAPLQRGSRMAWVSPGGERVGPRRGMYGLLPFAVAGDVVLLAAGGIFLLPFILMSVDQATGPIIR